MKTTFHPQSMLIGGVVSAVLTAMILPTFGQGRDWDDRRHAQAEGPLPASLLIDNGRYTIVASDRVAYLLDTQTGQVWKDRDASQVPMSSDGFFENKVGN